MLDSSTLRSYRYFRGPKQGLRAEDALRLARAETAADQLYSELEFSWQYDTDPDHSWCDDATMRAIERGAIEVLGLVLRRRCPCCGQQVTIDSLWGIYIHVDGEADFRRYCEAEMLAGADLDPGICPEKGVACA